MLKRLHQGHFYTRGSVACRGLAGLRLITQRREKLLVKGASLGLGCDGDLHVRYVPEAHRLSRMAGLWVVGCRKRT